MNSSHASLQKVCRDIDALKKQHGVTGRTKDWMLLVAVLRKDFGAGRHKSPNVKRLLHVAKLLQSQAYYQGRIHERLKL